MLLLYIIIKTDASIKHATMNSGNGWIANFSYGIPVCISTEYTDGNQLRGIEIYTIYKFTNSQYYNITIGIALDDDFTNFTRMKNQNIIIYYIPF